LKNLQGTMKLPLQPSQNINVQKWVVLLSVLLLAIKFTAYYYTHSVAILTDALESIVNVIASLIGLYSLFVAAQPRDKNHPYGHGKAEFLSAGVEGILVGLAGLFVLYEAINKLIQPSPVERVDLGIWLVSITAVINYLLGAICISKGKKSHSLALEASGRHLQTDTYSTIGVVIGLILIYLTNLVWIDSIIALFLSGFILFTSYKIIRQSVAGIMDEADTKLLSKMIAYINQHRSENWVDMHNLRVIKYGSVLHVDAHLTLPWYFNVKEAHFEVDKLTRLIQKKYGFSVELFIHTDGCLEGIQCSICTMPACMQRKQPMTKKVEWSYENVVVNEKHQSETS